ncbi:putative LPS assembly protein LptD [Sphingobacterium corticis]|uniref:LPS assembly protein LptD n=1 Tax=Sphingobacterium corticis TaxID=1812823 RepID=A0ABW5NG61_9SPHI
MNVLFANAQDVKPVLDTIPARDTSVVSTDTVQNNFRDATGQDTVVMKDAESDLETVVTIVANDSSVNEVSLNRLHLYGGAKVKYQDFELAADYIRLDRNTNLLFASGVRDHNDKYIGRPVVIMPGEGPIAVDSLIYNYKTQIPKTFGVMTEMDGAYIQARVVRRNIYEEMSLFDGLYSTCDLPEPHTHFGIKISKGLVVKNQIIAGPSYLVVQNIPMKFLAIPFGFFPKQDKPTSGMLFPSFGEDASRGFAMRDLGWYLTFNDYWDSEIRSNIFSKGAFEASIRTQYVVNYKFNGGFNIRYGSTPTGIEGTPSYNRAQDFNVTWNHTQRQEANPGTSFSASVNFGTSSYFRNTAANGTANFQALTQNNMSSNISYGKVFADGKVNFTSSLGHRQDIRTGAINLDLPTFSLNVSTFNPFKFGESTGEKWYERITVGYSVQGQNKLVTSDSLLFRKETLQNFTNGFQHTIPIALSLQVMKYFQFNTAVNYTERWYFQSTRNRLENNQIGFTEVRDTISGFRRAYDYSISSGLSTKVYGQYPKIGNIEAIRHVVTPSVNLNYRPDFGDPRYGFYRDYVNPQGLSSRYSIFQDGIYGTPGAGRSMGIGFSIDNNIEAKIRSDKDTTGSGIKKIPILQGLTFSGNYNIAADSLKLSNISFSGRTTLFNEKINLNFNGSFDPYTYDKVTGRKVNRFAIREGQLARLQSFGLSFDYSFNPDASKSRNNNVDSLRNNMPNMTQEQADALARVSRDPNAFVDFNIPWNLSGSFSFNYASVFRTEDLRMGSNITSTVQLHGDFNVTPKWKVQFNGGYDFGQMQVVIPQFSIYRDLHCWEMSFSWVPIGQFQSYNFTIRAKASILQDLKLMKRQSHYIF